MSELVREALRHYGRKARWGEINAYGQTKAVALGLTEADLVPLVKAVRPGAPLTGLHVRLKDMPKCSLPATGISFRYTHSGVWPY